MAGYHFISDLVLDCLIMIALADGRIVEVEISAIASTYEKITSISITNQEITTLLESIESSSEQKSPEDLLLQRFHAAILEKDPLVDDVMRLMMLEAAIYIACIDLEPSEGELNMVRRIGAILNITSSLTESYIKAESIKIGLAAY